LISVNGIPWRNFSKYKNCPNDPFQTFTKTCGGENRYLKLNVSNKTANIKDKNMPVDHVLHLNLVVDRFKCHKVCFFVITI